MIKQIENNFSITSPILVVVFFYKYRYAYVYSQMIVHTVSVHIIY